jgi:hypothetical protein
MGASLGSQRLEQDKCIDKIARGLLKSKGQPADYFESEELP